MRGSSDSFAKKPSPTKASGGLAAENRTSIPELASVGTSSGLQTKAPIPRLSNPQAASSFGSHAPLSSGASLRERSPAEKANTALARAAKKWTPASTGYLSYSHSQPPYTPVSFDGRKSFSKYEIGRPHNGLARELRSVSIQLPMAPVLNKSASESGTMGSGRAVFSAEKLVLGSKMKQDHSQDVPVQNEVSPQKATEEGNIVGQEDSAVEEISKSDNRKRWWSNYKLCQRHSVKEISTNANPTDEVNPAAELQPASNLEPATNEPST